ncbi:MAG: type VI secretion system protein ImpF [Flavobacteriales bacterium]|jgi:type VI secretion system protein ImpF
MNQDKKLLAPVLDRLIDTSGNIGEQQPHMVLRQLRESVRRDMESLFNTRIRCISSPDHSPHLNDSLLNYGIPDISAVNLVSKVHRNSFCREIEKTIKAYDPRIKSVKVSSVTGVDPEDPSVRFKVEATLHTNPSPERIIFDSALNPITHTMAITETN